MMQIEFTESPMKDVRFYQDDNLKRLVNITLEYFNTRVFEDILALISTDDLVLIRRLISKFKSDDDNSFGNIYDELSVILTDIYNEKNRDNLRGCFLELIVFELLNKKYDIISNRYEYGINGFLKINGQECKRSVDVFALCDMFKGFVCECKINSNGFEDHDIENLNLIYIHSHNILSPYVVSLSPRFFIERKLNELYKNDDSNVIVHGQFIKIISMTDFINFFN
ncbi:hypothetical protein [Methanobrevibacter ruminantium]|uniref:hypothetical protein n=1 Tax=Methanobrevibacter ruminantium TaxID=83816 RepID=UPI003F0ADED5